MELIELSEKRALRREEAAQVLRELADALARHNALDFLKDGIKLQVRVPAEVELEVEVEIESDESSLEIEISW